MRSTRLAPSRVLRFPSLTACSFVHLSRPLQTTLVPSRTHTCERPLPEIPRPPVPSPVKNPIQDTAPAAGPPTLSRP